MTHRASTQSAATLRALDLLQAVALSTGRYALVAGSLVELHCPDDDNLLNLNRAQITDDNIVCL